MAAVALEQAMIAIVQQDNIASPGTAQALNHPLGRLGFPIPRREGPHHNSRVAPPPDDASELRSAEPIGRTQPAGASTDSGLQRTVATAELFGNTPRGEKRQHRMRIGVIPDRVATLGNLPCELRKCTHVPANQEKRRAGVVLIEQMEQSRSDRRIRTIVKRECD